MYVIKAIVAAVVSGASALGTAAADGHITLVEVAAIVGATALGFGAVYAAPANATKPPAA